MKGLFGIGKLKDKLSAVRFDYTLTIHNLSPWPDAGNRAVAIGWQRGKKKRGATRSVYPSSQPGKLGNVARFNEKFELSATLYKSPTGSANPNQLGPFKKKCLILAVLETDGRTQATAALGRVVVDLAEFAAVDKQETRAFMVSCNRQIHAAVGDPQLLITIRTRWRKSSAAAGVGGDGAFDDSNSMSTDTTGSRMTQNLSSFLRYKYTGSGPATANEEQDLRGFESAASIRQRESMQPKAMNTITEYDDEPGGAPLDARMASGRTSASAALPPRAPNTYSAPAHDGGAGAVGGGGLRGRYGGAGAVTMPSPRGGSGGLDRESPNGPPLANKFSQMSVAPPHNNGGFDGPPSPRSSNSDLALTAGTPPGAVRAMGLQHISSFNLDGAQNELMMAAATEMCVHLARAVATNSRRTERAAHGSARRIARTMVCLGPQQAPHFCIHVLRMVNAQLECAGGELGPLAFWWSNLAHLRALLVHAGLSGAMPQPVVDQVLPSVQRLERVAFESLVAYLWDGVLLPAVTEGPEAGSGRSSATRSSAAVSKRAVQEAAIKRWLDGLRQVNARLGRLMVVRPNGRGQQPSYGHTGALRSQALHAVLKRVDALLFHHLVTQAGARGSTEQLMADYDPNGSLWGGPGIPPPNLDDASLPFTRSLLTFGSGMSVKMMVTRLQQWATSEGQVGEVEGNFGGPQGGSPALFPLLRATADLLMMPKELLMEATIRADVCQALSLKTMIAVLAAFQPDEFAVDAISPEVLRSLQEEELRRPPHIRPSLTDLSAGYRPPAEESLMGRVNTNVEPGVEYDADSEDELVGFGSMAAPSGANTRFRLLHELWYAGARFRGAMSIASSSRPGSQM